MTTEAPIETLPRPLRNLTLKETAVGIAIAAGIFQQAAGGFGFSMLPLVSIHCVALLMLGWQPTARRAFYTGIITGLCVFLPATAFFWKIFPGTAAVLWLLLALWHGLFLVLIRKLFIRFGIGWALLAAPILWTGLEYCRCELWPLRLTWLALGALPGGTPGIDRYWTGVYGSGFISMAIAAGGLALTILSSNRWLKVLAWSPLLLALVPLIQPNHPTSESGRARSVKIAGLQMEFPAQPAVLEELNNTLKEHTDAQLFILSEYTFTGGIPESVRNWCKQHGRWIIAGSRDWQDSSGHLATGARQSALALNWRGNFNSQQDFRNTAYVVDTNGVVVFAQSKTQPIQFMQDGLPAATQQVWNSPWGRIGIAICYDASYCGVVDRLVEQGAEALVFPAMDVLEWGETEHRWNAFQANLRSSEYHLPVVRVASSGISQYLPVSGQPTVTTAIGEGSHLYCELQIPPAAPGHIPWDRYAAPWCSLVAGVVLFLPAKRPTPLVA